MITYDDLAALSAEAHGVRFLHEVSPAIPGLLYQASKELVGFLFEDLRSLDLGQGLVYLDDVALPARYTDRYDSLFLRQFIANTIDLTYRVTAVWTPATNVAQELALSLLLDQAEAIAELFEVELPADWRAEVEEHLHEDLDFHLLWEDNVLDAETCRELGVAPLEFEFWFVPFNCDRSASPYSLAAGERV